MNKYRGRRFLNSQAMAASIKDAGLPQPAVSRHGPGHEAALQGALTTARSALLSRGQAGAPRAFLEVATQAYGPRSGPMGTAEMRAIAWGTY